MRLRSSLLVSAALVAVTVGTLFALEAGTQDRGLVRITISGESDLAKIEATGIPVYARLRSGTGMLLLAGATPREAVALGEHSVDFALLDLDVGDSRYYVAYLMPNSPRPDWTAYGDLLYQEGGYAILSMSFASAERLARTGIELRAVIADPKPLPAPAATGAAPAAVTADPYVQDMIDAVESLAVYTYTGDLSGEWPVNIGGSLYTIVTRYTYSGTPISKATEYAGDHLEDLGLDVEYHEWGGSDYPSVIGELPGSISPDSIVIICAHLDDMPSGPIAPGADDNASGSVTVLMAAEVMTRYSWRYTLRFALWTGEEQGLYGSYYYAQRCYSRGEDIVGVLNLDMIGYNTPGSDKGIDLHADNDGMPETMDFAQFFVDVVGAYNLDLIPEIIPNGTGASDHASFWDYGYLAILAIEDWDDFTPYYHTTSDLLQSLDMSYYVEYVKASVAAFAHMGIVHEDLSGIYDTPGGDRAAPSMTTLHPVRPNPARLSSSVRYDVSSPTVVEVAVLDAQGRLVRTLCRRHHSPGSYEAIWDGRNASGQVTPPGIYFFSLSTAGRVRSARKIVLVR
jgi:hypothetical protein